MAERCKWRDCELVGCDPIFDSHHRYVACLMRRVCSSRLLLAGTATAPITLSLRCHQSRTTGKAVGVKVTPSVPLSRSHGSSM